MVFNDRDFYSSVSTPNLTPAPAGQSSVDLQAVVTHEYGHYFGLDHSSVTGATMIPFISNNISQRTLELDDQAGISTSTPNRPRADSPRNGVDFFATTGKVSGTVLNGFQRLGDLRRACRGVQPGGSRRGAFGREHLRRADPAERSG